MSDADPELAGLLRKALLERPMPEEVRARLGPRRRWWVPAAAAVIVAALAAIVLMPSSAAPEEIVKIGDHHYVAAAGEPYTRGDVATVSTKVLGTDAAPAADAVGYDAAEIRPLHGDIVQVVYTRGEEALSAFILKPESFHVKDFKERDGVHFYACAWGTRSAVAVRAGNAYRVWVSDMGLNELVERVIEVERVRPSLQKLALRLKGGWWAGITRMVRSALRGMKGVISFEVDFETAEATLVYDEGITDYGKIRGVFERAGFRVERSER